ncbi:MAG: cytochrome c biogenesis protein ResB [Bacteroidales bacterium]|nr:cytochrome c biogenesis protein ResB [Bacteroidales bacterium]MBQ4012289.1 cytochrome c biogenesis protein ResB [Bacteroidales bacterium]
MAGFLLGGGILAAGILRQVFAGPFPWERLAFPRNLILLALFLLLLVLLYAFRRKVRLFAWMVRLDAAVPALCYCLGLTLVLGLVRQSGEGGGIPWLSRMLDFWPFVLSYAWLLTLLGLVSVKHLLLFRLREIPFLLNHAGLFLALACGALGSPDRQDLFMTVTEGTLATTAEDADGAVHTPGISVELHDFIMELYPLQPGARMQMPKRFASEITLFDREGKVCDAVIEVNKPLKAAGWTIYQYDYDAQAGPESRISVLELVRDPWQPFVLAGILMMLCGALCLFLFMAPRPKKEEVAR